MADERVPKPGELWPHRWLPMPPMAPARIVAVVTDSLFGGRQVIVFGHPGDSALYAKALDEFLSAYAAPVLDTTSQVVTPLRAVPS